MTSYFISDKLRWPLIQICINRGNLNIEQEDKHSNKLNVLTIKCIHINVHRHINIKRNTNHLGIHIQQSFSDIQESLPPYYDGDKPAVAPKPKTKKKKGSTVTSTATRTLDDGSTVTEVLHFYNVFSFGVNLISVFQNNLLSWWGYVQVIWTK